jgi:hypothetical protein
MGEAGCGASLGGGCGACEFYRGGGLANGVRGENA